MAFLIFGGLLFAARHYFHDCLAMKGKIEELETELGKIENKLGADSSLRKSMEHYFKDRLPTIIQDEVVVQSGSHVSMSSRRTESKQD